MTLRETFDALRKRGELALMPYVMAGFPTLDKSFIAMREVVDGGADIIEVGVPFSDPVADGATIEAAGHAALADGFRLTQLLARLRDSRLKCPTVLMSYLNPLIAFGRERLFDELGRAGVCGLIVPDLPLEEADDWRALGRARGIEIVFLVAPTSTDERITRIADATKGFIYAVSVAGTTGVRAELDTGVPAYLERLRRLTGKPIAVGFGVSRPEHVRFLRGKADGAVIGSRLVDAIRDGEDLTALIQSFKSATRG